MVMHSGDCDGDASSVGYFGSSWMQLTAAWPANYYTGGTRRKLVELDGRQVRVHAGRSSRRHQQSYGGKIRNRERVRRETTSR